MERLFKYNLCKILQDVNGEIELIPYWIKLDLLDRNVPIIIDPLKVHDNEFRAESGTIAYKLEDDFLWVKWTANKN